MLTKPYTTHANTPASLAKKALELVEQLHIYHALPAVNIKHDEEILKCKTVSGMRLDLQKPSCQHQL